jgi:hypothetical protein
MTKTEILSMVPIKDLTSGDILVIRFPEAALSPPQSVVASIREWLLRHGRDVQIIIAREDYSIEKMPKQERERLGFVTRATLDGELASMLADEAWRTCPCSACGFLKHTAERIEAQARA